MNYTRSIQPCLDYACSVWGNCSEGSKFSLLRLQKRAARIVLKNFDYENSSRFALIKCLGWQSLEQRRDYYLATQMYKCVHIFAPKSLCDMIVMASDINVRNTWNTNSLNVYNYYSEWSIAHSYTFVHCSLLQPKPNIESYRKSFKYAGGKIWNDLPNNIQNVSSMEAFKYAYKKLNFKCMNTHW